MPPFQPERVAVIGGGCTGITTFWALQNSAHDVHLFEASDSLGGRVNALPFEHNGHRVDVNTSSPNFNARASPNLVSLLDYLGITTAKAPFSFGATDGIDSFQWCGSILKSILLRPWTLCNLETYRILCDAIWLKYMAVDVLDPGFEACKPTDPQSLSSHEYLAGEEYSNTFIENYLAPLLSILWSTNAGKFLPRVPAKALVQALYHHQLLKPRQALPNWRRIGPGMSQFIQTMTKSFPSSKVHLKTRVTEIVQYGKKFGIMTSAGEELFFNHLVFAVNGQETIKILGSLANEQEKGIIRSLGSTRNISVLHSDPLLMPNVEDPGPACNYILGPSNQDWQTQPSNITTTTTTSHISSLSYIANFVDSIPSHLFGPIYITLNPFTPPHPSHVQGVWEFTDPEPSTQTLIAQHHLPTIQNKRGLSYGFCWTGRGHLEDAITAGLRIAIQDLGAEAPFHVQFHQDPLEAAASRPPPSLGLRDNVIRTIIRLIHIYVLILRFILVLLRALPGAAGKAKTRFRPVCNAATSGKKKRS
ncbi:FAD/NAD(P)-binding domain-containing protein [Aspergillus piperis CBS 112811]|uniref:FAD/NAD(P)-binding domain-containing protein n=1 Tax=Aspergillus piperis CBS 112811 TaxID=1448313 RepID=A0A8G1R210_9EURO|nr:FAD/NAD(P)-binding domain-containing protein [Aspergillus piperis CBS 112811]RAH58108.1 FAD/NAD(P)-binding domain-containing protein [Aspergillus piperis CBS 112811]